MIFRQHLKNILGDRVPEKMIDDVMSARRELQLLIEERRHELEKLPREERLMFVNEEIAKTMAKVRQVMGDSYFYEVFGQVNAKVIFMAENH